ncbi:MAG: hypothetical protein WC354_05555 [Candidatus Omnitrophota bacterium]|jgi:hypothetical protein
MKLITWILLAAVLLFVSLVYGVHIYLNIQGRSLLVDKLQEFLKREITVRSVKTRLPFDLVVKDLEIKGVAKFDKIIASGGVFDMLSGNIKLSQLVIRHAVIDIAKPLKEIPKVENPDNAAEVIEPVADAVPAAPAPVPVETTQETVKIPPIILKRVIITDSSINFIDPNIGEQGIKVAIKDINARIDNINLPVNGSQVTSFEFKGNIPWENIAETGKVILAGWIDLYKKNVDASLKVEDIDGVYLYPYYSSWVDLDKSHIDKAKLNFTSDIQGLNNDVIADCHLELTRIDFKPRKEEEAQHRAEKITKVVLDIFKSLNQGKVILDFKFKTKMDSPELGLAPIIKLALQDKIKQARKGSQLKPESVITVPGNIVKGTMTTAGELTRSLIDTVFGVGNGLKKAFENSFKKEDNVPVTNQTD